MRSAKVSGRLSRTWALRFVLWGAPQSIDRTLLLVVVSATLPCRCVVDDHDIGAVKSLAVIIKLRVLDSWFFSFIATILVVIIGDHSWHLSGNTYLLTDRSLLMRLELNSIRQILLV